MANYFATRYETPIVTSRMAAEAPWNAVEAKHWELARRLLNDLVWLEAMCQTSIRDADIFWRTMEREKADHFVVGLRRHMDGPESALTANRLDILCELAAQYCLYDSEGRKLALRTIRLYRERLMKDEATNGLQLAKLEMSQGALLLSGGEFDMAITCYLNAWGRANDMGNISLEGTASGALGTAHTQKVNFLLQFTGFKSLWDLHCEAREADKCFTMEYFAARQTNDGSMALDSLHGCFGIRLLMGKKTQARRIAQQVLQMVEQESIADPDKLASAYALLGKCSIVSGDGRQAAKYYEKAISCCRFVGNYYQLPERLLDLAYVHLHFGPMADNDRWNKTECLCAEAVHILQGHNGREDVLARAQNFARLAKTLQSSCNHLEYLRRCWARHKMRRRVTQGPFGHFLKKMFWVRGLPIIGLVIGAILLFRKQ
ncbi:hypothetical protein [Oligosphaera ethanolica]|uniref:Tetratricopeptide (TPR) repeat protein n=1 Tax=Oligosphaera ethanolica TaxID=760260 RepID=A0AAE4APC7_9BACT|nr:hypothetical protein [Oligosphaera ethanolica]MDQ0290561.1 tetratricopeptide (TPR) repeat protein [Oligosphaera ethanolica]